MEWKTNLRNAEDSSVDMKSDTLPILRTDAEKNLPVQILEEIESRLSVAEEIEETIHINLKRAERLRQAILKKEFSGRLLNSESSHDWIRAILFLQSGCGHQKQ